jgi:prevent-host-death family protein
MPLTVNMQDAKTQLSRLVAAAVRAETVIIANRGVPAVRLEPAAKPKKRPLGFVKGTLPASFFDALPEKEVKAWGL